jgi:hypothetical protein
VAAERSSGVILDDDGLMKMVGWWLVVVGWVVVDCVLAPKIEIIDWFKSILDDVWRCR